MENRQTPFAAAPPDGPGTIRSRKAAAKASREALHEMQRTLADLQFKAADMRDAPLANAVLDALRHVEQRLRENDTTRAKTS